MSGGIRRNWHFRDTKFKSFLGGACSKATLIWNAFGGLNVLAVCTLRPCYCPFSVRINGGWLPPTPGYYFWVQLIINIILVIWHSLNSIQG